ncbi:helix-turn-helix domain-containing protein [Chitinophaga nivalis]|uniref:AraC family transcriptional regulator n=1 Tax=Chitinophaga nivalis TaxID=2991709 RepID=A0ABT3IPM5_9BACT|nr:AraC family transcriptional regulator [Chitinophaga nivalis]MCW3464392.1 AraC family transcriptional regulator [Chitinophaga nivalis]MCW3485917.1 AraC family transcriptional regulator [Chitinophaga nivalis]
MKYQEIIPGEKLRPYVKCYYLFESAQEAAIEDMVFPGGHMEIIFNLGNGIWQSAAGEGFHTTPPVELWGKITQPLAVRSLGKHTMLGIRFHAHSAAYFLREELWRFNDQIADLRDLLGEPVKTLHARLLEQPQLHRRIELIEQFLIGRLALNARKADNITLIGQVIKEMQVSTDTDRIEAVAVKHNISSRYLRKLFMQYTGVSPKLYHKINRFQLSLQLMNKNATSLTAITYDCGYFDQSHFIRDFKHFAGITPSEYAPEQLPVSQAIAGK